MYRTILSATAATLLLADPSFAEIVARSEGGFALTYESSVNSSPDAILSALARPSDWWSGMHTYSGDASNITLVLAPGGCWCETWPGGGVKHGEVVLVLPERRLVRIVAPLGPLQSLGADAVLTISWADAEGGAARILKWTYLVDGPGTGAMAEAVDGVMAEQFARLADQLSAGA